MKNYFNKSDGERMTVVKKIAKRATIVIALVGIGYIAGRIAATNFTTSLIDSDTVENCIDGSSNVVSF